MDVRRVTLVWIAFIAGSVLLFTGLFWLLVRRYETWGPSLAEAFRTVVDSLATVGFAVEFGAVNSQVTWWLLYAMEATGIVIVLFTLVLSFLWAVHIYDRLR